MVCGQESFDDQNVQHPMTDKLWILALVTFPTGWPHFPEMVAWYSWNFGMWIAIGGAVCRPWWLSSACSFRLTVVISVLFSPKDGDDLQLRIVISAYFFTRIMILGPGILVRWCLEQFSLWSERFLDERRNACVIASVELVPPLFISIWRGFICWFVASLNVCFCFGVTESYRMFFPWRIVIGRPGWFSQYAILTNTPPPHYICPNIPSTIDYTKL